MATLLPTLNDHDYENWVKGGLSLKFARQGIVNFAERNLDQFHKDVLTSLQGLQCNSCSTENIIHCKRNNNFCQFDKNNCTVHDQKDSNKKCRSCPNSACSVVRDHIINHHRYCGPSWRNTDTSLWCREPWQLATCYMSVGYSASTSASETDFPGLLSVIINNKVFETEVTDNLASKNNVFCKARDARNAILHKADMRLSDTELTVHITTLDTMLSDAKCLAGHPDAIQAKALLQQITNNTIKISTTDEREVKAQALKAIEEKTKESLESLDAREATIQKNLNLKRKRAVTAIQKKEKEATVIIQSELDAGMTTAKNAKLEAIEAINTQKNLTVAAVQKAADEAKSNLESALKETLNQTKKALKEELLFVYQDGDHMSTSLGPLATDEDTHIEELYVAPSMELVDHQRDKDGGTSINSYQDIFKAGSKKIYIVGEAGTGKTSLSQNMVSTWYQVHTESIENMSDNQQAIAKFEFLFYISLRHAITDNTIDEMIRHQLLPNKPLLHEPLSMVLEENNCLIVLDGLDEWTTENKTAISSQVNSKLPGRDAVRKCTVLTTTRPWKLENIKLKYTQIDTKVTLLGIDGSSSEELIQKMINHLNDKFNCQKTYENYILEIESKDLDTLTTIPVILKQIVCLWHSGKQLGKTKSAIYIQTLELLFRFAQTRLNEDSKYQQKREEWKKSSFKLPPCFDENETCQDFKPLIAALSEFAFLTLFNDDQDSSLVFQSTKAGCRNLSPEEVSICLKIGILCQDKILTNCTSQYKKISFLHKTYQEFLAAVFVSLQPLETNQCIETILQLSVGYQFLNQFDVVTFIASICTSDITCALLNRSSTYADHFTQLTIIKCMKAGWTCSHNNRCLYMKTLEVHEPSEYFDQLCRVNIPITNYVSVYAPPTAQCLKYLLQIHTLRMLEIEKFSTTSMSEDILYDLIHHHIQTLIYIKIEKMTLRSNTKLSSLIVNVPNSMWLILKDITLSQQLLDSLNANLYVKLDLDNHTILPDIECTV